MAFPFEDLDVYKRSVQFSTEVESILDRERKRMSRSMADQLSRAALSIPLNIAEGSGRWHKPEKRQFFWIARGSSFECVPILEILLKKTFISGAERESLRGQLEVIGKMLTKLIQSHAD
jgi:four helix bundle protein